MRRLKVCNLLLLFILLVVSSICSVVNVVAVDTVSETILNASFEEGKETNSFGTKYYTPTNWSAKSFSSFHLETAIVNDGQKSIRIGSVGNGFFFNTSNKFAVDGDSLYEIGLMAYSKTANDTVFGIELVTFDDNGDEVETFSVSDILVDVANEWKKVSVLVGTNSVAKSASVAFYVVSGSGCYIDNVFIQEKNVVATNVGASIRISQETPGIRFVGSVDKTVYDDFVNRFSSVNAGILIIPKVYYDIVPEFTFFEIDRAGLPFLDIKADKWNNNDTASEDGFYGFNCAMVNIKPANVVQKFCARSYLRYFENGVEKFVYSDFSLGNNMRSVQEVAQTELNNNGNSYCLEDKEVLQYFANGGK